MWLIAVPALAFQPADPARRAMVLLHRSVDDAGEQVVLDTTLSGFPLLISLSPSNFDPEVDPTHLRVWGRDGSLLLHELEAGSRQELAVWVRADLPPDGEGPAWLWLDWSEPPLELPTPFTEWTAVYHLGLPAEGRDSLGAYPLTPLDAQAPPLVSPGRIGDAVSADRFDVQEDGLSGDPPNLGGGPFTLSAWLSSTESSILDASFVGRIGHWSLRGAENGVIELGLVGEPKRELGPFQGSWELFTLVHTSTATPIVRVYRNGRETHYLELVGPLDGPGDLEVVPRPPSDKHVAVDEVRLLPRFVDATWVRWDYLSQLGRLTTVCMPGQLVQTDDADDDGLCDPVDPCPEDPNQDVGGGDCPGTHTGTGTGTGTDGPPETGEPGADPSVVLPPLGNPGCACGPGGAPLLAPGAALGALALARRRRT